MRFAAWGTLSCVLAMGVADFTPAAQAINAGALTVLGWMIWYLLVKAFPAHIRAQKEDRKAFLDAFERESAAHAEAQIRARRDFRRSLTRVSNAMNTMAEAVLEIKRAG